MSKLRMWTGNFDGQRQGLVIATTKKRAMEIIGVGRTGFEGYWVEQPVDRGIAEHEVLYTRPMTRQSDRWEQGQCPLPGKCNRNCGAVAHLTDGRHRTDCAAYVPTIARKIRVSVLLPVTVEMVVTPYDDTQWDIVTVMHASVETPTARMVNENLDSATREEIDRLANLAEDMK